MAKFKIGDWFWYLEDKKPNRVKVEVILTEETAKGVVISYGFMTTNYMSKRFMKEAESFATVEELAASIIDAAKGGLVGELADPPDSKSGA